MTDVSPVKNVIQSEEIASRKAVAESLLTRLAETNNYMALNAIEVLGEVKSCYLTEAQFAAQKGYDYTLGFESRKWAIMSGQSISGSEYTTLTGVATLPDMTTTGRFLGQKRAGDSLGQVETNQNLSHNHSVTLTKSGSVPEAPTFRYEASAGYTAGSTTHTSTSSGGDQAKPETLRLNFFIKINN